MYFGVLAVGADVTGGFLAMRYIQASTSKIALIFKDFKAEFLKRAEGDVHFVCEDGIAIQNSVLHFVLVAVPFAPTSSAHEQFMASFLLWSHCVQPGSTAIMAVSFPAIISGTAKSMMMLISLGMGMCEMCRRVQKQGE